MAEQEKIDQNEPAQGEGPATAEPRAAEPAPDAPIEAEVPIESDEPAAAAEPTTAELAARFEAEKAQLTGQIAQLKDRWLRAAADLDNFRKRAAKQEAETTERARADALRTFLPVVDNVERALGFAVDIPAAATIADGLKLVLKSFFDAFAALGLQRIESVGRPFDPQRHEAIGQVETTEAVPGSIVQELQSGYLLKERLLRPALVSVARPPKPAGAGAAGDGAGDGDGGASSANPPGQEGT
jgi:molecular chaperone GrpE